MMKSERGTFALEIVLLAPLLLVLVFLTFEFGRVFGSWLVVTNAAREGARLGMELQCTPPQTANGACAPAAYDQDIVARVQATAGFLAGTATDTCDMNGHGGTANTGANTACTCSPSRLCVGIWRYTDTNGDNVAQVFVTYQVQTVTPITGAVPFIGTFNFQPTTYVVGYSHMRSL